MTVPSKEVLETRLSDIDWPDSIKVRASYLVLQMSNDLGRDATVVDFLLTPEKQMLTTPNFARKTLNMMHVVISDMTDGAYQKLWPSYHQLQMRRMAMTTNFAIQWAEDEGMEFLLGDRT
jgi:hypothetical protein